MFDAYARNLLVSMNEKPGVFTSQHLNQIVLTMPFGEAHNILENSTPPKLNEDISLQQHMQNTLFAFIAGKAEVYDLTKPVMIKRSILEVLEKWDDWCALRSYLEKNWLQPVVTFKNTHIDGYYLSDIRAVCIRPEPFKYG